jgi:hypothetical protein
MEVDPRRARGHSAHEWNAISLALLESEWVKTGW